jgi:hypothetical protein
MVQWEDPTHVRAFFARSFGYFSVVTANSHFH